MTKATFTTMIQLVIVIVLRRKNANCVEQNGNSDWVRGETVAVVKLHVRRG